MFDIGWSLIVWCMNGSQPVIWTRGVRGTVFSYPARPAARRSSYLSRPLVHILIFRPTRSPACETPDIFFSDHSIYVLL